MTNSKSARRRYNIRKAIADRPQTDGMNGSTGYLYVFRVSNTDLYKIGISGDYQKRLIALQASNPLLSFVLGRRVENVREVERSLHDAFKDKKYNREFYALSRDDIISIVARLDAIQS